MLVSPRLSGEESEYHVFNQFASATYEENVTVMVELLRKHGVRVLLLTRPTVLTRKMSAQDLKAQNVFFPYFPEAYSVPRLLSLHNAYNSSIRRLAARLHVPIVDLEEVFDRQDKRTLFWDTMHPSGKGHELIATTLALQVTEILAH